MKILGLKVDQYLPWEEHVVNVIKSSYDMLQSLKLLKRHTPHKLRKTAEALTKTDYGSVVYQNLPKITDQKITKCPNNFRWICIESLRKRM